MKKLFSTGPSNSSRLLALVLIAIALVVLDSHTQYLKPIRQQFSNLATPFYWLTSFPERLSEWGSDTLVSREEMMAENAALRSENYVLQQKLQKMAALVADNTRLGELLNSSESLDEDVLSAKLIGVSPDPRRHEIVLDKGLSDGIYEGQAVLDAEGLVGMVIEVADYSSRVLLIADGSNAVPVQVLRNNVRAIVEGSGAIDEMNVRHVAATTDIVEGDILVSSGLGRRYPAGYPVAKVSSVQVEGGQPFLTIKAKPAANLSRSRHFLLVFPEGSRQAGESGE